MLSKKSIGLTSVVALVVLAGALWLFNKAAPSKTTFSTVAVERGTIENTVSCTGTISPLSEVEVGTQISGNIDKVYADYNQKVKAGELLAKIDTELLEASLLNAEATLEQVQAALEEAEFNYSRNKSLFESNLIAEAELLPDKVTYLKAKAAIKVAESDVRKAKQNLSYAYIRSPIDGTVIEKEIEEGQTVAASYSTPTLFIIAEDFSKLEILAEVDESDIGSIKEGQSVKFEVPAYPDESFTGKVYQIRWQPEVVNNVVNYTVVIYAHNKGDKLLPGMTCTVDFIIEEAKDVLKISNAALNYQPDQELAGKVMEEKRNSGEMPSAPPSPENANIQKPAPGSGESFTPPQPPKGMGIVWFLNELGALDLTPVKTGITDGSMIELKEAGSLKEGTKVVTGTTSGELAEKESGDIKKQRRRFGGPPPF